MSNSQYSKPEVSQQILSIWNENEDKNSEDNGKLDKFKNFEEILKKTEEDIKKQKEADIEEFGELLGNGEAAEKERNKRRFEKQRNEYNKK